MRIGIWDAETVRTVDGQSLRVLVALACRESTGQVEVDDLRRQLRMSHARVCGALDRLADIGAIAYTYVLGIIDYRIRQKKAVRTVDVSEGHAKALCEMTPSACKLWFLLTSHTGKDEIAWPSLRRLATLMGKCMRTVELGLKVLTDLGLFVKQRVPWQKVPGFKWALNRRLPKRKRVAVFVRTRTFALNSRDSLRRVREHLKHEICLTGVEQKKTQIVVDIANLPDELKSIADLGRDQKVDHYMVGHLEHLGFSTRAAAWIATRCPREHVLIGFRRLLEGVRRIKDPKKYLLACLRRLT